LFMPRVCVVCGRPLIPQEEAVCLPCLADLPLTHYWEVPRNPMADRFNEKIDARGYAWAAALFFYGRTPGYDQITQSLKYERNFVVGRYFARMLAGYLASSSAFSDVDCIVPVPLHWTRRWRRGYNQAEIIARELASGLSAGIAVRMVPDLLRRARRTQRQAGISGSDDKARNVAGAFVVNYGAALKVTPTHILLVDDVFTTGSTLSECQRVLRAHFGDSVRISVATLACVG